MLLFGIDIRYICEYYSFHREQPRKEGRYVQNLRWDIIMILFNKFLIILMGMMNIALITIMIVNSNWFGVVVELMFFMYTLLLWWIFTYDLD